MRLLIASILAFSLTACSSHGGQDYLPSTAEVNAIMPSDRTVHLGPISPSSHIVSVEIAPAATPAEFATTGNYFFNGVHHGGTLPGYVVVYDGRPGDYVRVKFK